MKWIKRVFIGLVIIVFAALLHYFLPSRDIVQIVGTDVKRMDIGNSPWWDKPDAGTQKQSTRDVRFINSVWPDGKARVYRNEDTNWSFPPYFKFDSGDLSARAQSLANQKDDETWVAVYHYGWRIKLLSMFPNAYKIRQVAGPDARLVPWFNIAFLSLLAFTLISIWRLWRKFKRKRIDPIAEKIEDVAESAEADLKEKSGAVSGLFRRWFGTTKDKKP